MEQYIQEKCMKHIFLNFCKKGIQKDYRLLQSVKNMDILIQLQTGLLIDIGYICSYSGKIWKLRDILDVFLMMIWIPLGGFIYSHLIMKAI